MLFNFLTQLSPLLSATSETGSESINKGVVILLAIVFIIIEILYHSVFSVTYFGSNGCFTEVFVCFIISVFITGLIYFVLKKILKYIIIVAVILAILAIIGTIIKKKDE